MKFISLRNLFNENKILYFLKISFSVSNSILGKGVRLKKEGGRLGGGGTEGKGKKSGLNRWDKVGEALLVR